MENFNESSNQFGQQLFFLYFSHKRSVVAHANSLFPFENCCVYNWNCSTYQRPTSFEGALFAAETGSAASNQFENVALTKCGASALSRYTPVDKTPIEWPIPIKVRAIGQLLALETFWKKIRKLPAVAFEHNSTILLVNISLEEIFFQKN